MNGSEDSPVKLTSIIMIIRMHMSVCTRVAKASWIVRCVVEHFDQDFGTHLLSCPFLPFMHSLLQTWAVMHRNLIHCKCQLVLMRVGRWYWPTYFFLVFSPLEDLTGFTYRWLGKVRVEMFRFACSLRCCSFIHPQ